MSTITVTLTAICPGGNHLTFTISGDATGTVMDIKEDIASPITDDEAQAFVKVICKMAKLGRTFTQAKTMLQAGVTVTV